MATKTKSKRTASAKCALSSMRTVSTCQDYFPEFVPTPPDRSDNPPPCLEEAAMDWNAAIERNREALKRVLAMLVAMAGLGDRQSATGSRQSESAEAGSCTESDCLLPAADCRPHLPR